MVSDKCCPRAGHGPVQLGAAAVEEAVWERVREELLVKRARARFL